MYAAIQMNDSPARYLSPPVQKFTFMVRAAVSHISWNKNVLKEGLDNPPAQAYHPVQFDAIAPRSSCHAI